LIQALRSRLSYARSRFRSGELASSLSDNDAYPKFCAAAASDASTFEHFRRHADYSEILEHVTFALGKRYLKSFRNDDPFVVEATRICAQDVVGDPVKFDFPVVGSASPTTLRYLKVAWELNCLFGSLNGMEISEIGVGYGGQCRVICELSSPASYSVIDLEPVLSLVQRYLSAASPGAPVSLYAPDEVSPFSSDLVISNYAFSELRREVQEQYMNAIMDHAVRGYVTFNRIAPRSFRSITVEEFAERVGGIISRERPQSYPGNRLVHWNRLSQ
jgi:hypothetical protein